DLRQLELRKRRGEIIDLEVAIRTSATFVRILRDIIQRAPAQYCEEEAAALGVDADRVRMSLQRVTHGILTETSEQTFRLAETLPPESGQTERRRAGARAARARLSRPPTPTGRPAPRP